MRNQPTGTVTFLFTDIEGSTKLWEQHPEAMQKALARHDELLRQAIEAHGGYVFKTVGDAFCAAFATAPAALAAALSAQRALRDEAWGETPIKDRMALHTGATEEREGDYFGPPVNRVARLLSAGHGGQILLSLATQELVRDHLPEQVELRDMGEHHLKDLVRPEHVFQVVAADLVVDFPALKTLDMRPNNLPAQTTVFIGREAEIKAVVEKLSHPEVRLLTLTGPGGTGKTRLSLQVAADVLEQFVDGIFFVPLASISDPALVIPTIVQILGLQASGNTPPLEVLTAYLKSKQMLLVLDNFEQVVEAATEVNALLRAAAHMTILITSRTLLRLSGEHEYPVPPLQLPDPCKLPPLTRLTQYEAVQLFIDRARAVKAGFAVTNANAPAVAEICVKLDGLPLAIELAAARVRLLTPQKMLSRLDNRLRFLTGGARDLPSRQRTIRGAIEWSYDLLEAEEKILFHRLGMFVGGWTLEAAETICVIDDDLDVLTGLESLVDKSLVKQIEVEEEPRFLMLETIREYALERLAESAEENTIQQQYAQFFLALAEEAEPEIFGPEPAIWIQRLEKDYDNVRGALIWSIENAIEVGVQLAGALGIFWHVSARHREGCDWLRKILANTQDFGSEIEKYRAKAMYDGCRLARWMRDLTTARSWGEESVSLCRKIGDTRGLAHALLEFAAAVGYQGEIPKAVPLIEESITLFHQTDDTFGLIEALMLKAIGLYYVGNYEQARTTAEEGKALAQEVGDINHIAAMLNILGQITVFIQKDYEAACSLFEESVKLYRNANDKVGVASVLTYWGGMLHMQGNYKEARRCYAESLELEQKIGGEFDLAWLLSRLGYVALREDAWQEARTHFVKSLPLFQKHGDTQGISSCLIGLAGVADGQEQSERAGRLLGAAEAFSEIAITYPQEKLLILFEYDRILTAVRSTLGEEAFKAATAKGRAITLEQAISYGLEHDLESSA